MVAALDFLTMIGLCFRFQELDEPSGMSQLLVFQVFSRRRQSSTEELHIGKIRMGKLACT